MFFADNRNYGSGFCPYSQEKITECITRKIHTGALTTGGDAFYFEICVVSEIITYEKSSLKLIPRWQRKKKSSYNHLHFVKNAIKKISPDISYEVSETCFSDEREKKDGGFANVENGYIVFVSVPHSYSKMVYDNFAKIGKPFQNKLLSSHTQLLKKIVQFDSNRIIKRKPEAYLFDKGIVIPSLMGGYANYFFVSPNGMEDTYNDCASSIPIDFRSFGMTPLRNIYECYGFAMALVEIYRPIWEQHGELIIIYETNELYGEEGILVRFGVRKDKPKLQVW